MMSFTKKTRQQIIDYLREHDISPTMQRTAIAKMLLCEPNHLTADEIFKKIRNPNKLISKATVYNTLNEFVNKKLIRALTVRPGKTVYDSNTDTHFHIYNEDTGKLTDIPVDNIQISGLPVLPKGVKTTSVDLVIKVKNTV